MQILSSVYKSTKRAQIKTNLQFNTKLHLEHVQILSSVEPEKEIQMVVARAAEDHLPDELSHLRVH